MGFLHGSDFEQEFPGIMVRSFTEDHILFGAIATSFVGFKDVNITVRSKTQLCNISLRNSLALMP